MEVMIYVALMIARLNDNGHIFVWSIDNQLCPQISEDTPQYYSSLMQKCRDSDPIQRSTIEEICELTSNEVKADEIRQNNIKVREEHRTQHPEAIYSE
ncbi:29265_t:CDS:2, partial [Gigaspora margarita]